MVENALQCSTNELNTNIVTLFFHVTGWWRFRQQNLINLTQINNKIFFLLQAGGGLGIGGSIHIGNMLGSHESHRARLSSLILKILGGKCKHVM